MNMLLPRMFFVGYPTKNVPCFLSLFRIAFPCYFASFVQILINIIAIQHTQLFRLAANVARGCE